MSIKLDFYDKIVCNTVGKTFALAAKEMSCYETSFCKAWLKSDVCSLISTREETVICQSSTYYLNSLKNEIEPFSHTGYKMDEEVMYWMGYTLTYWMYMAGITGKEICERYNLAEILSQYDILHTMSVTAAIKTIEKNYTTAKVLLDSILHQNKI